MPANYKYSSFY